MKGLIDFLLDLTAAGLALSSAFLAFALSFLDAAIPAFVAETPVPTVVSLNAGLVIAIVVSVFRSRRDRPKPVIHQCPE